MSTLGFSQIDHGFEHDTPDGKLRLYHWQNKLMVYANGTLIGQEEIGYSAKALADSTRDSIVKPYVQQLRKNKVRKYLVERGFTEWEENSFSRQTGNYIDNLAYVERHDDGFVFGGDFFRWGVMLLDENGDDKAWQNGSAYWATDALQDFEVAMADLVGW